MAEAGATLDGLAYALNAIYGNNQVFYIMLTSQKITKSTTMAQAVNSELPASNGYYRLPVTFGPAYATIDGFEGVLSEKVQYTATGGALGPYTSIAVVTSSAGNTGAILAYVNLDNSATLVENATLSIQYPIEFIPATFGS